MNESIKHDEHVIKFYECKQTNTNISMQEKNLKIAWHEICDIELI